jgi:hypothetical protein
MSACDPTAKPDVFKDLFEILEKLMSKEMLNEPAE